MTTSNPVKDERSMDRHEMMLTHYPLARSIACRIYQRLPNSVDLDDLISAAVIGLLEAVDRYDSSRKVAFEAYAKHRIHGAVVDALREADWVPRSVRRKASRIDEAVSGLREDLGRTPTDSEVAEALGVSARRYDKMRRQAEIRQLLSLDAPVGEDNRTPLVEAVDSGEEDVVARWQHAELKEAAVAAIDNLPKRERRAIHLYYLREMSLKEVGAELGVSESRACQLCGSGIKRLRYRLRRMVA